MIGLIIGGLVLALLFGVVYWYKKNRKPMNRYRKRTAPSLAPQIKQAKESSLGANLLASFAESPDSDAVLGLKTETTENTVQVDSMTNTFEPKVSTEESFLLVLYLKAPEGSVYGGYELLQALLSSGLRYGKQRIFNRHIHKDGRGDVLFHLASAVQPGTFDLSEMGSFTCESLCLFFSANAVEKPLATFDLMLETIDQLVEDLGGDVLDEHRELFTKEKMVLYRQKIRAFEEQKITPDMFASISTELCK